jgi:uncharacterized protein (TIRG00374 family)
MTTPPTKRKNKVRQAAYIIFSILTTAIVFYYLFQNVSPTEVLAIVKEANRSALLAFFILSISMSIFRTWRYLLVLRVSGHVPSSISLFLVVLVRNFFSDLLPARLGTLIYVYIINTRLAVPLSAAGCSFALAFLFDILAIAPLVLVAALLVGGVANLNPIGLLIGAALLAVVVLVILYSLPLCCTFASSILSRVKTDRSWHSALLEQLKSLREELLRAKSGGIYLPLIVLSLGVRICKYGSLYFLLYALLAPLGYTLSQMVPAKIFVGLLVPEIAASLPISGIAGFGVYEGAWAFIFRLLGFPARVADLTAISHHLFTQVYGYSLGAGALMVLLLPFFKREQETDDSTESMPLSWTGQLFVLGKAAALSAVIAVAISCALLLNTTESTAHAQAHKPTGVTERGKRDAATFLSTLPGTIIFDSNRSGTFGVFKLLATGKVAPIFDSPEEDMFPAPSFDGKQIAFTRSMSSARSAPSDIWVMNSDGTNARLLIEDGTFPSWSADGKTLYFERRRKLFMAYHFDTKEVVKLFPGSAAKFKNYAIVKPRVSPDGKRVAFTSDRKGRWNAWMVDLEERSSQHIGSGCQPTWYSTKPELAWIHREKARSGSGMYHFTPSTKQRVELEDREGEFGHEYFPTLADKDRLLLHSACPPDQHSHEHDNYQIFAKVLDSGKLIRLTFDGATNRWPKLLPFPAP